MKKQFILACALALSACTSGTVKNTLGLDRAPPDEYRVVSRPPLSVPPQFTLRPPSVTDETPGQLPASEQAKSLITNGTVAAPDTADSESVTGGTKAESSFLENAGANKADPNIRKQLVEEHVAKQEKQDDSSWWDIMSTNPPKKDPVVDATKESARIKKDEDTGQAVTTGDTPDVKQRDTGVLGRIFGY